MDEDIGDAKQPESVAAVLKVFAIFSTRHSTHDATERALIGMASKKLIYDACRYAREHAYTYLDLAYITTDPTDKRESIASFKKGFGGEIVPEYQYEYVSAPVAFIRKLRTFL